MVHIAIMAALLYTHAYTRSSDYIIENDNTRENALSTGLGLDLIIVPGLGFTEVQYYTILGTSEHY